MTQKITVYSDYICPFCFIGKDRVDKLEKEFDIEVEWKGFEIHPETPPGGRELPEYLRGFATNVESSVQRLAREANVELRSPSVIANSKAAIEIAEFAKMKGRFREYNSAVFKAYWQEGKNIGDPEVLFDIVGRIGLDVEEIRGYLESGEARRQIAGYLEEVRRLGITGVPTFIVGDKMIVGAQPYEVLKEAVKGELHGGGDEGE
ncbi:MAG: DsbA family protein [Candidatus Hydrothermarchaeaceae archaeon]